MNERLTGNTKWRAESRFRAEPNLILQVEVSRDDGPRDYLGMPTYFAGTYWRDMRVEDLASIRVTADANDQTQTPPAGRCPHCYYGGGL